MRTRLIYLSTCAALLIGGFVPAPAYSQTVQCLQQAGTGINAGMWQSVRGYFGSLNFRKPSEIERSQLLLLRSQIVDLESQKQRLIGILDAHINGAVSGTGAFTQLSLSEIPEVLRRIDIVSQRLAIIAADGSLFVAEKAFKDIRLNLDYKRSASLCQLSREATLTNPDLVKMTGLLSELRQEAKAISDADEALGDYIVKISR